MNNIKFIDITQLPDDLWQDAKNLIALDSNGEVIKAAKEDTYSKEEIDDLIKDAEISADKLQNKIKINSANTDYVVTQPTVSGDSLVITDSMSDKNQYHTFGYDKSFTVINNGLLNASTPLYRGTNEYNCPKWDGNSIKFMYSAGYNVGVRLSIPYTYNGVKYVTHIDTTVSSSYRINIEFGEINDQNFVGYQSVPFKQSEIYKAFGAIGTFIFKKNDVSQDYSNSESTYSNYIFPSDTIEMTIANFPLTFENGEIETPRFYILSNNFIYGDVPTENYTSNYPERLSDYIRYANDVKAYILTDKNTTFKTINGQQITGDGDITIDANVDLSDYATKSELDTKQDKLVNGTNIKSINGTSLLSSGNMELATKEELNTKQDVITDLETIRSGAALGATALQEVPDTYALKSEIPDISTKQDKLVSGSNIKTVNGTSLLGSGNIEISTDVDLSNLATKAELATKQDVISDLETIRSGASLGATALQEVPEGYATEQWVNSQGFLKEHQDISNLATKAELATKQDVITDLDSIRSGAAKGATALQSVPDTYALKSEIPDITTKQDKLVSGTNIKSINGSSLLGSGNMELATKAELNEKQDTLVSGSNIKTVNGTSLLGSGDITIEGGSGNVDLTDYYTKSETNALVNPKLSQVTLTQAEYDALQTKEENVLYVISDAEDIKFKTINGAQITGEGNIEVATKAELETKQDVITDLDAIRSGAALGATALQEVPDTYALKSEIKTVNGISLIGSGNITIDTNVDLSGYYTKAEIDSMIGGASSTITEINNLVV